MGLYENLFKKEHLKDGDVISLSEHGRVGGLSTGQPFKFVTPIDGATPLEGNNPSLALTYDVNGDLETLTKSVGGTDYTKTLSYTARVLTSISAWVEV